MKKTMRIKFFDEQLGCFGKYSTEDKICKDHCVLRLRCAIEKDKKQHLEIMEDLLFSDAIYV